MLTLNRLIAVAAVAVAAVVLAACGSSSSSSSSGSSGSASSGTYSIGSPADLTGENAQFSESWMAGLNAAVAAVNAAGGIDGKKVTVKYEDLQSNPARATQVVTQMATSGKYDALIPTTAGNTSLPIVQAAARAKAFLLGGAAADGLQNPAVYPQSFNMNFPSAEEAAGGACMVQQLKYKKIAMATLSDPFSESQTTAISADLKKLGVEVTGTATWDFSDTNISAQLQKLKSGNPEAVFVVAYSTGVGVFFSSLKNLGWNIPVIGGISLASELVHLVSKPGTVPSTVLVQGTPSEAAPADENQQRAIKYLKSAGGVTKFTRSLTGYLYPYDALMTIKAAAEKAKSTDTATLIKTIQGFKANPQQTWITDQPVPQISAELHGLNNVEYSIVNAAAEAPEGILPAKEKIKKCITPSLTELLGPPAAG